MLKAGVDLRGLQPQMAIAYTIACEIYQSRHAPCVITSASDGKHGANSLHYQGLALDLRTNIMAAEDVTNIHRELKAALGEQFDVVLETDHIHLEYDPRDTPKMEA